MKTYVRLLLAVGLILSSLAVIAQVNSTASIEGSVVDKSKAAVVGATVTATNKDTAAVRTTTTNGTGGYRFDLLPAGMYIVKVTQTGFASATESNVELMVAHTAHIDITLSPGSTTENIEVTSETPLIDTESTSESLSITPQEIQDLPLNGRDFANLATLAPGARPVDSYDPTKNRIAVFSVNGGAGRNVNVTVNGVDNKDNTVGGP